jgi:hypothetical protein
MLWEIFANCWGIHPQTDMHVGTTDVPTHSPDLPNHFANVPQSGLSKQLKGKTITVNIGWRLSLPLLKEFSIGRITE